ncbi:YeeE/YedE family protein [Ferrimonas senticii]|uniref:YeeE/YedE family protein n=1 Tax=Ferrimonas senticii TaxID=394566 RepID=UPI0004201B7C|nr:hypothetical protein [Ferrimonas senticii]
MDSLTINGWAALFADWLPSLLGGMLLGGSALLLLLVNGRIAGISGITGGLLRAGGDKLWRGLFLLGMILGGALSVAFLGGVIPAMLPMPPWQLALAGLLVGLGTAIGNGCTSGHGICGLGRLSRRSMVATALFMAVAVVVASLRLHLWGLN